MIERLDHATIHCADLARSLAFHVGVLGLVQGPRPDFDFPGAWLYAGDHAVLHLVAGRPARPAGVIDHVAFAARDLRGMLARIQAAGLPHKLVQLPGGGAWQLFCHDPDGARIELDFAPQERP